METPAWPEPPQATLNDLLDALNRINLAVESQTTALNNLLNHFVSEVTSPGIAIRAPTPVPPRPSEFNFNPTSPLPVPIPTNSNETLSPIVFRFDQPVPPSPTFTTTVPVSIPTAQGTVQTTLPITVPLPVHQSNLQQQSPQVHVFQLKRLTSESLQMPPAAAVQSESALVEDCGRTIVKTNKRVLVELLSRQTLEGDSPDDNSEDEAAAVERFSRSFRAQRTRFGHASMMVRSKNRPMTRSLSTRRNRASMRETPFSTDSSPVVTLDQLLGKVRLAARYLDQKDTLIVTELEGIGLELVDAEASCQIRVAFFGPKVVKHRTAFLEGSNPKFRETFTFTHITQEELVESVLRVRIYRKRTSGRHQFLGESLLRTSLLDAKSGNTTKHSLHLHPNTDKNLNVFSPMQLMGRRISASSTQSPARNSPVLCATPVNSAPSPSPSNSVSRRNSSVDSCGRFCSLPQANGNPELLISLCYLETQGKVVVGVEKASGMSNANGKPRDTYIRVAALTQYGEELGKHKTDVVRSANEPVYNDTAVFSIPLADLETSSVKVEVFSYCGVWRKKLALGYTCLGENSTTPDQQEHWYQMIQGMGTTVSKWHHLLRPSDQPTLQLAK